MVGLPGQAQTAGTASDLQLPSNSSRTGTLPGLTLLERQQFINALQSVERIRFASQQQATDVLKDERFSIERFNEILQAQRNPQAEPVNLSEREQERFDQAMTRLNELDRTAQTRMQEAIQREGLDPQRFNQLYTAMQRNPEFQRQIMQQIQGTRPTAPADSQ